MQPYSVTTGVGGSNRTLLTSGAPYNASAAYNRGGRFMVATEGNASVLAFNNRSPYARTPADDVARQPR